LYILAKHLGPLASNALTSLASAACFSRLCPQASTCAGWNIRVICSSCWPTIGEPQLLPLRGATLRRTPLVRSPHMPQLRVSPGCALRHQLAPAGTLVSYVSVSGQTIGEPQLLPFARCHPLADTFIFISHGVPSGYVLSSVRVVTGASGHMIWIAVCCKPSGLHPLLHSMSTFVMGHHKIDFLGADLMAACRTNCFLQLT